MGPRSALGTLILVWALVAGAIMLARGLSRRPGAGLVQAYVLNLGLLHWLAAALYLLPWYANHDPNVVALGLQQGTYAVVGFGVGSLLLAPMFARSAGGAATGVARGASEP